MVIRNRSELDSAVDAVTADLMHAVKKGLVILRMPDGSLSVSADAHSTMKSLKRDGDTYNIIRSIILTACNRSEMIGMGSSKFLIRSLRNIVLAQRQGIENARIRASVKSILDKLPSVTIPTSRESVAACLHSSTPETAELILQAVDLAGSECKIFVEPSTSGNNVIERIDGHSFTAVPDASFLKVGKWHASNVKCLVVDGIIERVSEIDFLLENCHKTKRPMMIFARGFSDEVLGTLRVNFARKTLNVVPVVIAFDLETVNILLDVAVVLGGDVISSLKGELISAAKFENLMVARDIRCTGAAITIITDPGQGLAAHVKYLTQKRSDEPLPLVKLILDKRIRSLSSASVVVRVTDVGFQGSKIMHDIDAGLKVIRNVLQYGSVTLESIESINALGIMDNVIDGPCSTLALGAGMHYALSVAESLASADISSCF